MAHTVSLTNVGDSYIAPEGVKFEAATSIVSGTGGYFTFLAVHSNTGTEEGFNHDSAALLDTDAAKTKSLQVGQMEVVNIGGVDYFVLRLDMNEPGNASNSEAPINLLEFKLYTSNSIATSADFNPNQDGVGDGGLGAGFTKFFDLDAGHDLTLQLKDLSSGSGGDDYQVLIPTSIVTGGTYLTLYWKFNDAQGGFEEARALTVPFIPNPALSIEKSVVNIVDGADWGGSGQADSPGDIINYSILVQNIGNVPLTGLVVTDKVEAYATTNATPVLVAGFNAGDANTNGVFDVGEIWQFTSSYTLTQADLDNRGGGDGDIDNVATATTNETGPETDDAVVELVFVPGVDIEKYVRINGGAWDDADFVTGPFALSTDTIEFQFVVTNTGNVALTNLVVSDSDFDLDPGAGTTWNIANLGAGASTDLIISAPWQAGQHSNTGTVNATYQGAPLTDSDLAHYFGANPAIDVEKYVSVDGGVTWEDADVATGPFALFGTADIMFKFVVTNVGNVDLTDVEVSDSDFDLDPGAGTTWLVGNLAVGASDEFIYDLDELTEFVPGQHVNTATATGMFDVTLVQDTDDAHYWGVVGEGLSHGYWRNHAEDWDIGAPDTNSFEAFFGVDAAVWLLGSAGKKAITAGDISFQEALMLPGGGMQALAREAVAAVLNILDEDINYGYDLATVIGFVQTAFATGDFDTFKNLLENENTAGDWF